MKTEPLSPEALRALFAHLPEHLAHVLPGQAPIRDFVHHNTLHGYQHLRFSEALRVARQKTGARGYYPFERYRAWHAAGRIDDADLDWALERRFGAPLLDTPLGGLPRRFWLRAALLDDVSPMPVAALRSRADLLADDARWHACLAALAIPDPATTPVDAPRQDEASLRQLAEARWTALAARVGSEWTLRALLLHLTGEDALATVLPRLLRQLGAQLDQQQMPWPPAARDRGFYASWLAEAKLDAGWLLDGPVDAAREIAALPADAETALAQELAALGLPGTRWGDYLERLALELPGFSGMFLWRHLHPGYRDAPMVPVSIVDCLAVRLILERIHCQDIMQRHFGLPVTAPVLPTLRKYFAARAAELLVRDARGAGELPEALTGHCGGGHGREAVARRSVSGETPANPLPQTAWQDWARQWLAHQATIAPWRTAAARAWPVYRLSAAVGLPPGRLDAALAGELLDVLATLDEDTTGEIWLNAYERHYREQIFTALHGRLQQGPQQPAAPRAQLVFCMDDREEGMRRHLEELAPHYETFGGAAHFAVFHNYIGLDDSKPTPLAPVVPEVVRPAHEVRELPRAAAEASDRRQRLARLRAGLAALLQWPQNRPVQGGLLAALAAPAVLTALTLRLFAPAAWAGWKLARRRRHLGQPATVLAASRAEDGHVPTADAPAAGFTDAEAAGKLAGYLTALGLTRDFAPLVVIVGHGSNSENNPHLSAYDCGACAGRHSGPNARLFAHLANRPGVRVELARHGIVLPASTWFLGCEHNTCDDRIEWYDTGDLPAALQDEFAALAQALLAAGKRHARERCRRLFSAPPRPSEERAWRHVLDRRHDFAQPRPELGHATNACAIFGRRSLTRGLFLDRRSFLISYDPTQDPEGRILERHLLVNGAVGAGISLEYYFSSVDDERYGCGSKVLHNVIGGLGVMQGAASDLRTGLPRQMIELHEAMRLLIVVENSRAMVEAIYARQPPLQELVGNGWVQLAVIEPQNGAIFLFLPERGWQAWQGLAELPQVACSADWFLGHNEALGPALIKEKA